MKNIIKLLFLIMICFIGVSCGENNPENNIDKIKITVDEKALTANSLTLGYEAFVLTAGFSVPTVEISKIDKNPIQDGYELKVNNKTLNDGESYLFEGKIYYPFKNKENPIKEEPIIKVSLDTANYKVSSLSEGFNVKLIPDPNFLKITIEISADKPTNFKEGFKLYVNDELESGEHIKILDGKIIYEIKDPNWSPFY